MLKKNSTYLERSAIDMLERKLPTESQILPTAGRRFSQGGFHYNKIKVRIQI